MVCCKPSPEKACTQGQLNRGTCADPEGGGGGGGGGAGGPDSL